MKNNIIEINADTRIIKVTNLKGGIILMSDAANVSPNKLGLYFKRGFNLQNITLLDLCKQINPEGSFWQLKPTE